MAQDCTICNGQLELYDEIVELEKKSPGQTRFMQKGFTSILEVSGTEYKLKETAKGNADLFSFKGDINGKEMNNMFDYVGPVSSRLMFERTSISTNGREKIKNLTEEAERASKAIRSEKLQDVTASTRKRARGNIVTKLSKSLHKRPVNTIPGVVVPIKPTAVENKKQNPKQLLVKFLALNPSPMTKIKRHFATSCSSQLLNHFVKNVATFRAPGLFHLNKEGWKLLQSLPIDYSEEEKEKIAVNAPKHVLEEMGIESKDNTDTLDATVVSNVGKEESSAVKIPQIFSKVGDSIGSTDDYHAARALFDAKYTEYRDVDARIENINLAIDDLQRLKEHHAKSNDVDAVERVTHDIKALKEEKEPDLKRLQARYRNLHLELRALKESVAHFVAKFKPDTQ